jgi:hypothetical protein
MLDPVDVYTDMIKRLVLLLHLLLHHRLITDVPITPALRVIARVSQ